MPAKRIIILDKADAGGRFRYLLWADVPTARQPFYAQLGKISRWKDASAGDNAALASGAVIELEDIVSIDTNATIGQIQSTLQTRWTAYQAEVNGLNQWNRYGTYWDGTAWNAGGIA